MAVYTDITDEELGALLADFDLGAPLAFKGIAEGVENSNFLLETETGPLHPDGLREAGAGGGPAVLPRADALAGAARLSLRRRRSPTGTARR